MSISIYIYSSFPPDVADETADGAMQDLWASGYEPGEGIAYAGYLDVDECLARIDAAAWARFPAFIKGRLLATQSIIDIRNPVLWAQTPAEAVAVEACLLVPDGLVLNDGDFVPVEYALKCLRSRDLAATGGGWLSAYTGPTKDLDAAYANGPLPLPRSLAPGERQKLFAGAKLGAGDALEALGTMRRRCLSAIEDLEIRPRFRAAMMAAAPAVSEFLGLLLTKGPEAVLTVNGTAESLGALMTTMDALLKRVYAGPLKP